MCYMHNIYLHCCVQHCVVVGRVGIRALSGSARQVPGSLGLSTGRSRIYILIRILMSHFETCLNCRGGSSERITAAGCVSSFQMELNRMRTQNQVHISFREAPFGRCLYPNRYYPRLPRSLRIFSRQEMLIPKTPGEFYAPS